jgi:hypothetical protein
MSADESGQNVQNTQTSQAPQASPAAGATERWPALPLDAWQATYDTLHMWTQIAGKVKLELCPFLNEWWEVALHLAARGLTTGPVPSTAGVFAVDFDFLDHNLYIRTSDGGVKALPLLPRAVADFYAEFMAALGTLGIDVTINTMPQEVEHPIPFEQDRQHAAYDAAYVTRWWRILTQIGTVIERYRSGFVGKSSPVQFFWGGFDLNATRFSGKPTQPPTQGGRIMRYAEDQENVAVGFWPGGDKLKEAALYSYTYPEPAGFKSASIRPSAAYYDTGLGEFVLNYEDVRRGADPEGMIMEFLQSTYEVGATLAGWDRAALEQHGTPDVGPRVAPQSTP